jgi:hypothetical protein
LLQASEPPGFFIAFLHQLTLLPTAKTSRLNNEPNRHFVVVVPAKSVCDRQTTQGLRGGALVDDVNTGPSLTRYSVFAAFTRAYFKTDISNGFRSSTAAAYTHPESDPEIMDTRNKTRNHPSEILLSVGNMHTFRRDL